MIDDKLVLVRQRRSGAPYYLLPGGGVDSGETVGHALVREVAEETGLECRLIKPLFINDTISPQGDRHLVNITFLAEVTGGFLTQQPADTSIECVELVRIEDVMSLDFRPALGAALHDAYVHQFNAPAQYLGSIWTPEEGPVR